MLLNTSKFNLIVDYFKLTEPLNYYKLYNASSYRNSYHGYMHVVKFICSLYELSNTTYFSTTYSQLRSMMIAAIFHDFNYHHFDAHNEKYDVPNIEAAVEGFENYINFTGKNGHSLDLIKSLISSTEYPKCTKIELTGLEKIFVECDHSMVLYEDYYLASFLFQINEYKQELSLDNFKNMESSIKSYLNSIHFSTPVFLNAFNSGKSEILSKLSLWYLELSYQHESNYSNYIIKEMKEKMELI